MKTTKLAYMVSGKGVITTILDGKTNQTHPRTPFYDEILVAVKARDAAKYRELSDMKSRLELVSKARISFAGGAFTLDGKPMHNAMTKRFVRLVEDGHDMAPFMAFIKNCLLNPRQEAIDELYTFLENNDLPITEDGCFLAYKFVNQDYTSWHANKDGTHNLNYVGTVVQMPMSECCQDRKIGCAAGLHCCQLDYCKSWGSTYRIVVVRVNPCDVASVPDDCSFQKLRACKYEVVAEHFDGDSCDSLSQNGVYSVDSKGIKKYSRRDAKGRFTK